MLLHNYNTAFHYRNACIFYFQALLAIYCFYTSLNFNWRTNFSCHIGNVASLSQHYPYFHSKSSDGLKVLTSPVLTLISKTRHATRSNHYHSRCIPLVRRNSIRTASSQESLLPRECFPIATILTTSSLGRNIFFPTYTHKFHFLSPPPLMFMQYSHSVTVYM